MIKQFISFLILITFCSCGSETSKMKFDVENWNNETDRGFYNYRHAMLDDLFDNYELKGKTVEEITEIFHFFDSTKNIISFEVYQEWKGIDPSYTKYLNLRLNNNSIVDSVYMSEYRR